MKEKYPQSDSISYYNRLNSLRQTDFVTIQQYQCEINYICVRFAICNEWNDELRTQKMQETFYNGLSRRTQLEMARLNVRNFAEMYSIINTTEITILEQLKAPQGKNKHQEKYETKDRRENLRKSERTSLTKKYCEYHKSNSHNTADCRSKPKPESQKAQYNDSHKNKTMALREPSPIPKALEVSGYIKDKNIAIMIDTGSANNYIKSEIVEKLNQRTEPSNKHEAMIANGRSVFSNKIAEINFKLQNDSNIEYKCTTRILDSLATDLILGMEFLLK